MTHPEHIIVLAGKTISLYTTLGLPPQAEPFPEKFVSSQEVLEPKELVNNLADLLKKIGITKATLLVLADDVIYQETFRPAISNDTDPKVGAFLDKIPFERNKIVFRTLTGQGMTAIVATNRELSESVVHAIQKAGGSCIATVPLLSYGKPFHTPLTADEQHYLAGEMRIPKFAEILSPKKDSWYRGIAKLFKR